MVGRQAELARVGSALDALSSGDGARLMEVSGEAGIGKTRLLDEVCDRARRRAFLVFRGRAAEFERGVPFAPVVEALDDHLASLGAAHVALRHDALRSELGAVFPSLRGASTVDAGVHDERYRAYRAVRELLERLSGPHPLVLVIDDAHWADDASVELVSALLQKPPGGRVMIAP
jgi:predicted ATPase